MQAGRRERVRAVVSLREYFRNSVDQVMARRGLQADDLTAYYVVNLLTLFSRSERLFERTNGYVGLRPLALLLGEALEAPTADRRNAALQRIGDVSLFVAGFFAESLARKLVDVDYYVNMGGSAYGSLSSSVRGTLRGRALSGVFAELAEKFQAFVDVLGDVRDDASAEVDVLRQYEIWLRTGSARAAELLRKAGVEPNQALDADTRH